MGGNDDDESAFQPHRGKPMDLNDMKVEIAKIRERIANQRTDMTSHDAEFTKVWSIIDKLEERLRSVEVKIAVIAFGSACGGGVAGSLLSNYFK